MINWVFSVRLNHLLVTLTLLVFGLMTGVNATKPAPVDISSQVSVTTGNFVYNRATKLYAGNITIKNNGSAINAQVAVALSNHTAGVMGSLLRQSLILPNAEYLSPSWRQRVNVAGIAK